MEFYTILGLAMIAGNIIASVLSFWWMETSPKWLKITAGVLNLFMLLALIGMTK